MITKNCEGCLFFVDIGAEQIGKCRKNPPTLMFAPVMVTNLANQQELQFRTATEIPAVLKSGWCGQYQDAPSKLAMA